MLLALAEILSSRGTASTFINAHIDDPLMPCIDQKLVNSSINTPSMAIDGAIDAIDAINGNSVRRSGQPGFELQLI